MRPVISSLGPVVNMIIFFKYIYIYILFIYFYNEYVIKLTHQTYRKPLLISVDIVIFYQETKKIKKRKKK